jgi:phage shock protein PspC (stress-responsive transcriptional regulator)
MKRLTRSKKDRMLGGVAGGIGKYFEIDPVLVRLLFAFGAFTGAGLIAYIILWIIVPEEGEPDRPITERAEEWAQTVSQKAETFGQKPEEKSSGRSSNDKDHKGALVTGLVLILIGGLFLLNTCFPWMAFDRFWPVILILMGIAILWKPKK